MKTNKRGVLCLVALLIPLGELRPQSLLSFKSISKEQQKATEQGETPTNIKYSILLSAELRDVIGKKEAGKSTFGTASFGITRADSKTSLSLLIKVADNQDPISSYYSRALLNPSGLERASGYIDFMFNLSKCSLRAYGTAATNDWQISDDATGESTSIQATILAVGVGVYKNLWEEPIDDANTETRANMFLGLTSRIISGDLAYNVNNNLRNRILGRENKFFPGLEFYWDIYFGGIKGFFDATWFPHEIPGFSKLRLTAGIGLQMDVLTFKK